MAAASGYHMRNKAYCNEEPKLIEATQPDRWQSACRIKPLVHSVYATKPFMSRYVIFNIINSYFQFCPKLVAHTYILDIFKNMNYGINH